MSTVIKINRPVHESHTTYYLLYDYFLPRRGAMIASSISTDIELEVEVVCIRTVPPFSLGAQRGAY